MCYMPMLLSCPYLGCNWHDFPHHIPTRLHVAARLTHAASPCCAHTGPFQAWHAGRHRDHRVCPWFGTWREARWQRPYLFSVEDPFDDQDNAARAVGTATHSGGTSAYIAHAFAESLEVVKGLAEWSG